MAVTLNALTTGVGGLQTTGDTSGQISLQSNGSTVVAVTASGVATTGTLSATGNISTPTGTITASSFVGNGASLTGIAGGFSNMTVFTSPGTFTTPASTTRIKVTVVGGGGNGGNSTAPTGVVGSGGGGGGAAIFVGPVAASSPFAVTVGGATGTSSFAALASATGGSSGPAGGNGGDGGAGSAGTLLIKGSAGGPINRADGGSSILGGSSRQNPGTGAGPYVGMAGANYGGGGAGATTPGNNSGGAGAGGVVIVEF